MSTNKSIAFFVNSINDMCVSINGVAYDTVVNQMPNVNHAYWLQADPDGIQDLCTQIDDTITSISGEFIDQQNNHYTLTSVDFIGGHPPVRPH